MATDIEPSPAFAPQIGRVYLRVSTDAQDLRRQDAIVAEAKAAGYYVAAVYREKASGARADRPELLRMIADLQPGEVLVHDKICPRPTSSKTPGQEGAASAAKRPSNLQASAR